MEERRERLRRYAEIVYEVAERLDRERGSGALTCPDLGGTVLPGPEVEPQHITNQHEQ